MLFTYDKVKIWLAGSTVAVGDAIGIGWHIVGLLARVRVRTCRPRLRRRVVVGRRLSARKFAAMQNQAMVTNISASCGGRELGGTSNRKRPVRMGCRGMDRIDIAHA